MPLSILLAPEVLALLSGECFSFCLISTILVLMTTFARNLISNGLMRIGYGIGRCLQYGRHWFILACPTNTRDQHKEKFVGANFRRIVSLLLLLYTWHTHTSWNLWLFTNFHAQYALEGGCQQIMCVGLHTKWLKWHQMYLRVGWWT